MQSVAQTEPFYLFQKLKKDLTDSPIFDILQLMTVLGTTDDFILYVRAFPGVDDEIKVYYVLYWGLATLLSLTCQGTFDLPRRVNTVFRRLCFIAK